MNGELEFFLEDDVLPRCLLYLLPERVVPLPETLVEDEDLFMKLAGPGTNTSEEGQQNILRSFVKDEVLYIINVPNRPLATARSVALLGAPVVKRTNLNDVEDQIYVLPGNVESPKADLLNQSTALTAPACERDERDNGVKHRVRYGLYQCLWEVEDPEGKRVGCDNRMLGVVLGKQVLAA